MRRRIDTHEGFSDCTTRPHHYLNEYGGELSLETPPPALYDDVLWAELVEAQLRLREVEVRVLAALVEEPLDAVEVELGRQLWRMNAPSGSYDQIEWSRLEDVLRSYASTLERKP